jgi:hypothetical protein
MATAQKKRTMSPQRRKAIADKVRQRWAEKKAKEAQAPNGHGPEQEQPNVPLAIDPPTKTSKSGCVKQVMNSARCEILELRRLNEVLAAKVDTLEIFAASLGMRNGQPGECVDVAWELQNAINSLE